MQACLNRQVAERLGSSGEAALLSTVVGSLSLVAAALVQLAVEGGDARALSQSAVGVPAWMLLGGVIGALLVLSALVLASLVGVTMYFTLYVAGQLLSSLALDELGLFGVDRMPVTWKRLIGTATVLVAALAYGASSLVRRWQRGAKTEASAANKV